MRRPLWSRVLITLWGIWFAAALTEPADLFGCPMHSAVAAAASIAPSTSTSAEHAHHAAAVEREADQGDAESTTSNCCNCLGQCATMSPALVPSDAPTISVAATVTSEPATCLPDVHIPQRVALRLPFAIGPPHSTLL